MGKIVTLDNATISKIAAGEIIDRPASVVKEMLENSIDAGAKNITVEIRGNTDQYLRITDDGEGMSEEDLEAAFQRHATSKITNIEDLNNLHTLGFRGEALPSIAHVSSLEVISRPEEANYGTRLLIDYGEKVRKESTGSPIGTTFIVRNIFKNLPVRKKFLKTDQVEYRHIGNVVEKIALGTLDTAITLIRNYKTVFQSVPNEEPLNHIYSILGRDIATNLIPVEFNSSSYNIKGYLSNSRLYRSSRAHQYLYINGRYVKNLDLSREIESLYRSKIPLNKYPVYILYVETDPMLVDVNIHPKKQEVKLSNQNQLIPILKELYREAFPDVVKAPQWKAPREESSEPTVFDLFPEPSKADNTDFQSGREILKPEKPEENGRVYEEKESFDTAEPLKKFERVSSESNRKNDEKSERDRIPREALYIGSLFKTYLIFQDTKNDTVYLLDQHAAHERILYEQYRREFKEEKVSRQILLTPEIIRCTPTEMSAVEEHRDTLKRLGFTVDIFGDREILLREVPYFFGKPGAADFFSDILENIHRIDTAYDLNIYEIMRKACRAAIKAGDVIDPGEAKALIERLFQCEEPHTCPHGRPVFLKLKRREIEKMFYRVES